MKTEAEIRQALRDWIVKTNGKVDLAQIADDTPIVEQRIISSLKIMDLILYIERLSGKSIDVDSLTSGTFRSIDSIYNNFFAEG